MPRDLYSDAEKSYIIQRRQEGYDYMPFCAGSRIYCDKKGGVIIFNNNNGYLLIWEKLENNEMYSVSVSAYDARNKKKRLCGLFESKNLHYTESESSRLMARLRDSEGDLSGIVREYFERSSMCTRDMKISVFDEDGRRMHSNYLPEQSAQLELDFA